MSRSLWLLTISTSLLCACAGRLPIRECSAPAVKPVLVTVERKVYVTIPSALTRAPIVAEGTLSACPQVAAARRAELEHCESSMKQIRSIQGTEVNP